MIAFGFDNIFSVIILIYNIIHFYRFGERISVDYAISGLLVMCNGIGRTICDITIYP